MSTTRSTHVFDAPRERVFRTLLDPALIPLWRVPAGMRCHVHAFDPRAGGRFRVSLTYDAPGAAGKSSAHTDTYHGYFAEIEPGTRIVEVLEFETSDPALQGEMRITTTLADVGGATELTAVHEGLPSGVAPADNVEGWRQSLAKLAALLGGPGRAL
ncbi:MAG: SRPBCC domain-containing protein [Gemmatimonadaceae bacterium]